MSVPSGASFTLPMPPTMRSVPSSVCNFLSKEHSSYDTNIFVPSAVYTFLSKEHSSYDTNMFDIGVIWSMAPESKIQVF